MTILKIPIDTDFSALMMLGLDYLNVFSTELVKIEWLNDNYDDFKITFLISIKRSPIPHSISQFGEQYI